MKRIFLLISFVLPAIAGCNTKQARQNDTAETTIQLKLMGQVAIPYNFNYKGTVVGGLSGLAYEAVTGQFYVVSDDRSYKSRARFYTFKVKLTEKGLLKDGSIHFTGVHILKIASGQPYKPGTIDPEGIALGADGLVYVSSEGDPRKGVAPFINGYKKDGTFVRALLVPKAFWNLNADHQGIRTNLAFETLTTAQDGHILYTATENALLQDGPAADSTHNSRARIMAYDLGTGKVLHQYQYRVDSVFVTTGPRGSFAVNGLTDMVALDNQGHFLALERNFVMGQGNHISLYKVSVAKATDIKSVFSVKDYDQPIEPVHKEMVALLNEFELQIDNFEGIELGPKLPSGGRLLLIVSDNNFSSSQQTLFTAFLLHKR